MFDTPFNLPPPQAGQPFFRYTGPGPIVITGANGAGKSRLGIWIEESNQTPPIHRISAQRALTFKVDIDPKPEERIRRGLDFGYEEESAHIGNRIGSRWGQKPHNYILDDFDLVLSGLKADERRRNHDYYERSKQSSSKLPEVPSAIEKLQTIWASIYPHRHLDFTRDRVQASEPGGVIYSGVDLSDGERVTLYLIGQCLVAKPGSVLIIDEPEIHLHRAIQDKLWNEVEAARPDCCFVYITHDLVFATSRVADKRIWVQKYNGAAWEWDDVPTTEDIPEEIVLQVLGTRQPTLIVEGRVSSLDYRCYTTIFPNHRIIPREGCEMVVNTVNALSGITGIHHLAVQGLIDRDVRNDAELASYVGQGVFSMKIAEIENLLCAEEIVKGVAQRLSQSPDEAFAKAQGRCWQGYTRDRETQTGMRARAAISFALCGYGPTELTLAELVQSLSAHKNGIDAAVAYGEAETELQSVFDSTNYDELLRTYNNKGLIATVAASLGLSHTSYITAAFSVLSDLRRQTPFPLQRFVPEGLTA